MNGETPQNYEHTQLNDLLWRDKYWKLNKIFSDPKFQEFVKWLQTDSYEEKKNWNTDDNISIASFFEDLKDINYLKDINALKEEVSKKIDIKLLKTHYEDLPENDPARKRMMSIIFLTWLIKAWSYNIEAWDTLSTLKNSLYSKMKVKFNENIDTNELDINRNLNFNLKWDKVDISYKWEEIWNITFINWSDPVIIKHFLNTIN